jgi:serine/threonine protein kinase
MPPEVIACQQSKSIRYDPSKADIFSLGVLLFALVLNKLPFEYANSNNRLFRLVQEEKWADFWAHHSEIYKLEVEEGERVQEFKVLF